MTYRPYSSIKSTGFEFNYFNGSGITIDKGIPVKVKTDGNVDFINVSLEADVFALAGATSISASNGAKISIVTAGRVEDIISSFSFGDPVYIDKTGFLTNIKPTEGINGFLSGDWVVRIGTLSKNESNQALKDLILELDIVGQL